ncbi:hypothetical protein [Dapis sp. BLCC M229]|uniref:hypothetical protein n=1 Tax=Dapis sp. BLCC M229 TaxID=3400188 RepID=UPI003CE997B4
MVKKRGACNCWLKSGIIYNLSCDRDLNAALNLAMAGSSPVTACGLDDADVARMKQEWNR